MRIADLFNQMSPSALRAEPACTYRLFRMQQTHKSVSDLIELIVDIFETSTLVELLDLLAEASGGLSQRQNNVSACERRRFAILELFLLILDPVVTLAI